MAESVALVYVGPASGGIEHPVTGEHVPHGSTFEVPADMGKSLLEQVDNFERATKKKES